MPNTPNNTKYIDGIILDKAPRRAFCTPDDRPTMKMPVGQALHLQAECLWGGAIEDTVADVEVLP